MSKNSGTATMGDIARRVGVSRTAVSFVLNGRAREKGISRNMEQRILHVAQELSYRPSLIAKSLVTRKTMTIGLVLPNMSVSYGPPLAETIEVCALNEGYQVLLCHHGNDEQRLDDILRLMTARRVDGLIIVPTTDSAHSPVLIELLDSDLPLVFVERDPDDERVSYVSSDPTLAARLAVDHLTRLGHRRIAFFNAAPELVASRHRLHGYRDALHNAGIAFDEQLVWTGRPAEEPLDEIAPRLQSLRRLAPLVTALVVVSAARTITCLLAAERNRIAVPAQLSVVSITGFEFGPFHKLRPTIVHLPYEAVGRTALRILLEQMRSSAAPVRQRVLINPQLRPGQSTAAPPAGAEHA